MSNSVAYSLLVAYGFAFVAAVALAFTLGRRYLVFSSAALASLAVSYLLGAADVHSRMVHGPYLFYGFSDGFRILFAAITFHEAIRVMVRLGGNLMTVDDERQARILPWFLYAIAALIFFVAVKDGGTHGAVPINFVFSLVTLFTVLVRLVNRLRPKELDPDTTFRSWVSDPDELGLIQLHLSSRPKVTVAPVLTKSEAGNISSLVLLGIVATIPTALNSGLNVSSLPVLFGNAACSLLLLPCFFGMVQFQARDLFFDVVVKRGVLFVFLALLCSAMWPLLGLSVQPETLALLAIASALMLAGWAWLYSRADTLLNAVIFHRRDYAKLLNEMTQTLTQSATEADLVEYVKTGLVTSLRADWVEWSAQVDKPSAATMRIAAGDRVFGYLLCGPRYRSQPYRSADLQFLDSVGAHFTSALQGFEARRLEELAARSELKALRAQINPHFLFNALNTLADMSRSTPEAEQAILNLARVFRFALDSTRRETVPLREEIAFVRSYLEIEKARFESKLRFSIDVPDNLLDHPIPPMLLQPLVENAIKHGLSRKIEGGWVRVSAIPSLHGLTFKVEDNGVGFEPSGVTENIGISNVRSRVEAMGGNWMVDAAPGRGAAFSFELPIPQVTV